ncbi:group III truncated hemoglobin [Borborobacter arsenicus]|nr:group III truncated hemoglobin [Pseudaminobacter arsenicus]
MSHIKAMGNAATLPFSIVSEESIRCLVDGFYDKVRQDSELGPIFEEALGQDWGPHLTKMYDFWSSLMLTSGRYKGNPLAVHQRLDTLQIGHFERWLGLFEQTCHELFGPEVAEAFLIRAHRIAGNFKLALFYRPDRPWPPEVAR